MTSVGGWKNRITSTMHTNSRMNDLLNENMSLMSLGKKKNLHRIKEAMQAEAISAAQTSAGGETSSSDKDAKKNDQITKPSADQMNRIIKETIYEQLSEEKFFATYNSQISSKFCQILSREIIRRIKLLNQSRFRVVCFVTIIEKLQQAANYKMMFCLDPINDNFATFTHEEATYYIVATAFLIYQD